MGYSTEFKGQFDLDVRLPREYEDRLLLLQDQDTRDLDDDEDYPGYFCQWILSKDRMHLRWDLGEKFNDYAEWLQWIIDEICTPAGVLLTGRVEYQGDDVGDHGFLVIKDGQVERTQCPLVNDTFDELLAFRDFVLRSDYADDIATAWRRRR